MRNMYTLYKLIIMSCDCKNKYVRILIFRRLSDGNIKFHLDVFQFSLHTQKHSLVVQFLSLYANYNCMASKLEGHVCRLFRGHPN